MREESYPNAEERRELARVEHEQTIALERARFERERDAHYKREVQRTVEKGHAGLTHLCMEYAFPALEDDYLHLARKWDSEPRNGREKYFHESEVGEAAWAWLFEARNRVYRNEDESPMFSEHFSLLTRALTAVMDVIGLHTPALWRFLVESSPPSTVKKTNLRQALRMAEGDLLRLQAAWELRNGSSSQASGWQSNAGEIPFETRLDFVRTSMRSRPTLWQVVEVALEFSSRFTVQDLVNELERRQTGTKPGSRKNAMKQVSTGDRAHCLFKVISHGPKNKYTYLRYDLHLKGQ